MLVGQPELSEILSRPELRQLRQRIVLRHELRPFTADEIKDYVNERLRLAGYTGKGIFDRGALKELFAVTGGVPRLVNVVCDGALLTGFARGQTTLGRSVIREVANDLKLCEPSGGDAPPAAASRRRGWFGRRRSRANGPR
jgi:general secretion pathway protein A